MSPVSPSVVSDHPAVETVEAPDLRERGLIPRVLVPALRWWLLSQLDVAEGLEIDLRVGDRQLLRGQLPFVRLGATVASYRGILLRQVAVQAEHIRINLGQVVRGKPLKLLAPVPVEGELMVTQADLQGSVDSPLLQSGLRSLLRHLQKEGLGKAGVDLSEWQMVSAAVTLGAGQLDLAFTMQTAQQQMSWVCTTGIRLEDERTLCLHHLQWQGEATVHPPVTIDLGAGVALQELLLQAGRLRVRGMICIYP
ncbi:LmeA family phospholipid-binding protein [Parathermosynechococcus lividus]